MQPAIAEAQEMKNLGICATCNHLTDCLHRLDNGMVIWFCDMFDDLDPPKSQPKPPETATATLVDEPNKHMGLCSNCEHRDHCVHSKTPGGVWHCEEYL